jgi:hypothetical protein
MTTKAQQIEETCNRVLAQCEGASLSEAIGMGLRKFHGTALDAVIHDLVASPKAEGHAVFASWTKGRDAFVSALRAKVTA